MRLILPASFFIMGIISSAIAAGPNPRSSPWLQNGATVYYDNGGVTLGQPTGGSKGVGTLNVKNGVYVNGVLLTSGGGGGSINPPTPSTLGGIFQSSSPLSNWARGVDSSGNLLYSRPTFSDISGSVLSNQLPSPTVTSLGGILVITCGASNWISAITPSGQPTCSQPNFTDILGTVSSSQLASGAAATNLGSVGGDLIGTWPSLTVAPGAITSS